MKKEEIKKMKTSKLKRTGKILYAALGVFLVAIALLTISSVLGFPKKLQVFVVQSGSMEPAIDTGSIAFVQPQAEYNEGDIITFTSADNPEVTITHRVIEKNTDDNVISFITQGDANESPDANLVQKDTVIGKVSFSVPYIGYPIAFAKTEMGFVLLIIIPATLIIYSEIIVIKKEAKKLLKKRKEKKEKAQKPENGSNILNLKEKHEKDN